MRRLAAIILLLLTLAACAGDQVSGEAQVRYVHDDQHAVGCWLYTGGGGIACLPDRDYRVQP